MSTPINVRPVPALLAVALAAVVAVLEPMPTAAATPPPAEAALTGVRSVAVGKGHACAVLVNGQLRCWGENGNGELGVGFEGSAGLRPRVTLNPGGTGPLRNVVQVAVADSHTCAVLANGQVRCWGYNYGGQLGDGGFNDSSLPRVVVDEAGTGPLRGVRRVTTGSSGTCALLTSTEVRCWGPDDRGQLGDGSMGGSSELPVPVRNATGTANLGGVVALDGGGSSHCAVLDNGQARCWGDNLLGGLGDGTDVGSALPVVVKNGAGTGPLRGVTQLSVGKYHTCARLRSGQARCWGPNSFGTLGDGTGSRHFLPVAVRTGRGAVLRGVRSVVAGWQHTCAALTSGQARCWGADDLSQLGDGTPAAPLARFSPSPVRNRAGTARLRNVVGLSTSVSSTCARRTDGRLLCWGSGEGGVLGDGFDSNRALPVLVQV